MTALAPTPTTAQAGVLLEITNLSAGYSGIPVVHGLNMEVHAGEIVALLGPNGAGKTTTLLTVSGFVKPLDGGVNVLGEPTSTGAPHRVARRGLAHVAEDRSLFFGLTVSENLRLGLHGTRADRAKALEDALSLLPVLAPLLDRRAGLLSGGEQQMLALARALVSRPRLLVVDEMSLGLAPLIVERLLTIVRQIVERSGIGVLIVEQHVHLALETADRAYVLSHGQIVLEGDANELAERPELVEASYLGGTSL